MSTKYYTRGPFPEAINVQFAHAIGTNFVKYINAKAIVIGYDNRFSSPSLTEALMSSISCKVINIGLCSTPMLYFAIKYLQLDGGIIVTASHNPITFNGFKLFKREWPLTHHEIRQLLTMRYVPQKIHKKIIHYDISPYYIKNILKNHSANKKLKIAWDLGSCTLGKIIALLTKELGTHKHYLLNEIVLEYATADPMLDDNLSAIKQLVKDKKCDVGFSFDTDGDRLRVINNAGEALSSSYAFMILVQYVLTKSTDKQTVVIDVKLSDQVIKLVETLGGKCIRCQTGHSIMHHTLKNSNAIMAGDGSGHIFFEHDDALYAALLFVEILSRSNWEEINSKLSPIYVMPETRIPVSNKNIIITNLKKYLIDANIEFDGTDGIRVNVQDGWWLIRASNTEELISISCESTTKNKLNEVYKHALNAFKKSH